MSTIEEKKESNTINRADTMTDKNNEEDDKSPKIEDNKIVIVPFKNVFLKIFKGNHYYILDRYRYDISTIMMLLDLNKINKLHDFYSSYPDGIERSLFVKTLEKELPNNLTDPTDQTNLVYGLYKFFCEIDFNGDGQMQWEEFTQFIIDTVEGDNDAKLDEAEDFDKTQIFNAKKMIKYKRYHVSNRIKDNLIHKKDVICAAFIPRLDIILVPYSFITIKSALETKIADVTSFLCIILSLILLLIKYFLYLNIFFSLKIFLILSFSFSSTFASESPSTVSIIN